MPKIVVTNTLSAVTGIPRELSKYIYDQLSVKDPSAFFSPAFQTGSWDGFQRFFSIKTGAFHTGLLGKVVAIMDDYYDSPDNYKIEDNRTNSNFTLSPIKMGYSLQNKQLRDYQVKAVNEVVKSHINHLPFYRGIINLATNAGKTTVAAAIIDLLYDQLKKQKQVLLFITHSKEIAYQAQQSLADDLGVDIGFIGDGKWQPKTVTIALVPTLYKRMKKKEWKDFVPSVAAFIGDEIHHSSSVSWMKVTDSMKNAYIRLGLTGTVDKKHPDRVMKLYSVTGPIKAKVTNSYLIDHGYSAKPTCYLYHVKFPDLENTTIDYHDTYSKGIVNNSYRNEVIAQICASESAGGHTVLVLIEYLDQGRNIAAHLEQMGVEAYFTHGQLHPLERKRLLKELKDGKLGVLIASNILDEGVDVSGIDALVYARGMESTRKLLQGLGRGLRRKEGRNEMRFYDFIDDTHSQLLKHSNSRYKILKAEGFNIKMLKLDKLSDITVA